MIGQSSQSIGYLLSYAPNKDEIPPSISVIHLAYQPICLLACLPTFLPNGYMSSQRSRHCERTEGGRRGEERGEGTSPRCPRSARCDNQYVPFRTTREGEGQGEVRCGDGRLAWHVSVDEGEVLPSLPESCRAKSVLLRTPRNADESSLHIQVNYIWIKN